MNREKGPNRIILVSGLKIALRLADERDIGFCYELMAHNMRNLFDRNTLERWSRAKFKSGYKQDRIRVLEHKGMPIGFYDCELTGEKLYVHNLQLSEDYQRGVGTEVVKLIEQAAIDSGAKVIIGKVFAENSRIIGWLQKLGYDLDKRIEDENSYWIRKDLEKSR